MTETESDRLEYIRDVFKELPAERKDYVLGIARSLYEIQENSVHLSGTENPSLKVKGKL